MTESKRRPVELALGLFGYHGQYCDIEHNKLNATLNKNAMENNQENCFNYETTVAFLQFNFRQYSDKATIIGSVFAQSIEEIDRFLFFQRWVYHCFEPHKKWAIDNFVIQNKEVEPNETKKSLKKYYQKLFSWKEQEKIIAELIFTRIVNWYTIYIKDIAGQVMHQTELEKKHNKKFDLSSYPKIKAFYKDYLYTPLFTKPEEENLAGQIITIRNLIVHSISFIPDNYVTKFHNWKDLECLKQDADILYIQLDFSSLGKLGNFLVKSVADIDNRLSEKFNIESYYFDEKDIPVNEKSPTGIEDEDFSENID